MKEQKGGKHVNHSQSDKEKQKQKTVECIIVLPTLV